MLGYFFQARRRISAIDCLLDYLKQRQGHSDVEIDITLRADNLEREMPLAIERTSKVLLERTGNDIVYKCRFADGFIRYVAKVAVTYFDIFARWRQMNQHRHHLQ